jgi:HD-like signal output (HDOD) protein
MGKYSILLAMADDAHRAALCYVLEREGFISVPARSAAEACAISQQQDWHVGLLDWSLCNDPQIRLIQTLRRNPKSAELPIILLGQPRTKEELAALAREGVQGLIVPKGFTVESFVEKIRQTLSKVKVTLAEQEAAGAEPSASAAALAAAGPGREVAKLNAREVQQMLEKQTRDDLPIFEFTANELLRATCSTSTTAEELANIVLRDPACVVHLLHRVNHADILRDRKMITGPHEAVSALGMRNLLQFVEHVPTASAAEHPWGDFHGLMHSLGTSRIAALLATRLNLGSADVAATAGVVHDIGRFVLEKLYPQQMQALNDCEPPQGMRWCDFEKRKLGLSHAEAGSWLLENMRVPAPLVECVRDHHAPTPIRQHLRGQAKLMAMLVQAADQLTTLLWAAAESNDTIEPFPTDFEEAIRAMNLDMRELVGQCMGVLRQASTELMVFNSEASVHLAPPRRMTAKISYVTAKPRPADVLRVFLNARGATVEDLAASQIQEAMTAASQSVVVVNLSDVPNAEAAAQVLIRVQQSPLSKRKGLVIIDESSRGALKPAMDRLKWVALGMPMSMRRCTGAIGQLVAELAGPQVEAKAA